jgi:FAD/FMN-containing dehydrogenase/Fe-S oxidoreductase
LVTKSVLRIEQALREKIEGEVRFDRASRILYSTDASNYKQVPIGVVIPRHEGDVAAAISIARENAMPLLARGGGTSLAGQATSAALVLDFSKYMNAIRKVDVARRFAIVEPGVVQSRLNAHLAQFDLFFAPDPTTKDRCSIGGMIGNNSCGAHSVAYGKTVENVEALEVLLYDGSRLGVGPDPSCLDAKPELRTKLRELGARNATLIRSRYPKIPRRVSGYNLDQLVPENGLDDGFNLARALVGSEGTLAITLGARLKLVARPRKRAIVVMGFDDIFVAADQAPWILEHRPDALEGFDGKLVEFTKITGLHAESLHLLPPGGGFLIAEVSANGDSGVSDRSADLGARAQRTPGCSGVRVYPNDREQRAIWSLRESGLGASALIAGYPRTWPGAEDAAVAPEKLGSFLREFDALLQQEGLEVASWYGHFGDGCVHSRINFDLFSREGIARFRTTLERFAELVVRFGGSLSGEHGDGIARSELLPKMFGSELIDAFAEFKRIFDPDFRMNPGVIVDPFPLDSHLRIGPGYRAPKIATHFDYSADGGFAGAALKCVGVGKCRKTDAGTMCPSYMATMEEQHSTRGRAHVLLEAMTGATNGVGDAAVGEAMELCLSCKACKRECPAGVDMARYKSEFLAGYFTRQRRPLKSSVFGQVHRIARLSSLAPRMANAMANAPAVSALIKRALGIHQERKMPALAHQTFRAWFAANRGIDSKREVVLFADTFTNFFEPQVAIAAVRVLERAGLRVIVPAADLCCGRPMYDQGMLSAARGRLAGVLEVLGPYAESGVPIVGLEPSCILTFRDELPGLFPNHPASKPLAERSMLLNEFIARETLGFTSSLIQRRALVHGHCHQKAIAGIESELSVLRRIKDLRVDEIDAGCCGMAGAFGYDAEHFELSRKIGERVLLPAVRQTDPATLIVADGFSCRSQITQFCNGRRALHLAQVLDLATTPAERFDPRRA